jgi:AcrR family transcriptional regulator
MTSSEDSRFPADTQLGARPRIFEAMLDLATSEGYETVTIERLCEHAGIEPADFSAQFKSLEQCALELVEDFLPPIQRSAQAAFDAEPRWPDSLRAASWQVADWIDTHPREVRFGAVELPKVGEIGQVRVEEAFKYFIPMIDAGREASGDPDAPRLIGERAVGSLALMLAKLLRDGAPLEPHRYMRELMYLAVLPYLGPDEAAKQLTIGRPGEADRPA